MELSTSRKNILLSSELFEEEMFFWKEYLISDSNVTTHFLPDFKKEDQESYIKSSLHFIVPAEINSKIQKIINHSQMGYYVMLVSVINMILQNHVSGDQTGIGIPVVTKGIPHQQHLSKLLPLVVSTKSSKDQTYIEHLSEIMGSLKSIDRYKNIPFEYIGERLGEYKDKTYRETFGTAVVMDGIQDKNEIENLELNILFTIHTSIQDVSIEIMYNAALFKEVTMKRIEKKILNVLEQVSTNPRIKISQIELIDVEEKELILHQFSGTTSRYPKEKTVKDLFEEQCRLHPMKKALVYNGESISYQELNERANQVARVLRKEGVQEESVVGISVEQGFDRFIGILGIIKAGGAFLPIDDEYPKERKEYMLKDSGAKLIIIGANHQRELDFNGKIIDITKMPLETEEKSNIDIPLHARRLVYIMYTSGSTGKPKGVMIEHQNVVQLVKEIDYVQFEKTDRMLQGSTIVFDASTFEIWGALLNGLELHLIDKEIMLDAVQLEEKLTTNQITIMWMTAPLFNQISKNKPAMFQGLRYLLVGGDTLSLEPIERVRVACPGLKILNGYGPTENTTFSTTHLIDRKYTKTIPIGKPITNSKVYIVDANMNLQPIGAIGEIYVGGDGVARGYINHGTLNEQKFINNPFEKGSRLYCTGDVGRWLQDGSIEYLGRVDHQVKIRGYRIEIGEIEHVLHTHPQVKEAVILVGEREGADKYISAYVVLNTGEKVDIANVKAYVREKLPDYMQPSFIFPINEIPLTINGKVDKVALLKKEKENRVADIEEPTNEIEEQLLAIWKEMFQIEKISIHHNFYELGGNSLIAIKLINNIRNRLKCDCQLVDMLSHVNIRELANFLTKQKEKTVTDEPFSPIKQDIDSQHILEASHLQRRIYMEDVMKKAGISYNIPVFIQAKGNLDKSSLEKATNLLVKRHESLRTRFQFNKDTLYQVIEPYQYFSIPYKRVQSTQVQEEMEAFIRPFNLTVGPLFRLEVLEVSKEETIIMLDAHHSISDGRSTEILIDELTKAYNGSELPELNYQYKDFSEMQNRNLVQENDQAAEAYWERQLGDGDTLIELPLDYQITSTQAFEGAEVRTFLHEKSTLLIEEMSKELKVTNYVMFLTMLNILFTKYTQKNRITIASPVTHRVNSEWESVVGMFVNMLPIKSEMNKDSNVFELVQKVSEQVLEAFKNMDYQFDKLVEKIGLTRTNGPNPIFNVSFDMHHHEIGQELRQNGEVQFELLDIENHISKFDVSIVAIKKQTGIELVYQYNTKLFKEETIVQLSRYFMNIVKQVSQHPELTLSEISLGTSEEKELILHQFSGTTSRYPKEKTIKELFEEQCRLHPMKRALVYNGESICYQELNERANQVARVLRREGVQEESVVGISVEQGFDRIIGILGIIKAGGAFLPIDDNYPQERKEYMLKDSGAKFLIRGANQQQDLDFNGKIIDITKKRLETEEKSNIDIPLHARSLVYIMYTSGSTGKPKGVMIEHQNVVQLVKEIDYVQFEKTDRMLQGSTIVFDASTFEIWGALLNGLELHLIDKEIMLDAVQLEEKLTTNQITIMWMTAPLFNQISKNKPAMFQGLRYLLVGGDALSLEPIERVRVACPGLKILNGYGPTENTTFSTTHLIDRKYTKTIPIGKPITNSKVYIVDANMNLQPIGAIGEIYVGGDGVARGYINHGTLNEQKFINNPFEKGSRLYCTGDVGRWLQDGSIEYLGRVDHQVKIRGYRIEIGEIEHVLHTHPQVKEAVILVREREGADKYISAYVVLKEGEKVDIANVKAYVRKKLPDYMQPSFIFLLDEIPLTINGKVDKVVLLKKEKEITIADIEDPTNEIEEQLLRIWQITLNNEYIGVDDNFFEVGGNSILLISMHEKLVETFQMESEIEIADLFANPTISRLAEFIEELA